MEIFMKIGIITYHRAVNYGAYLQACALCSRLNEESNITAEIIDFQMKKENKKYSYNWPLWVRIKHPKKYNFYRKRKEAFNCAIDGSFMKKSKEYCQSDEMHDFKEFVFGKYDVIITGSDEIWNFNNFRGFPTPYWLIGDLGCKKISYAASCRQDFNFLSDKNKKLIQDTLSEYVFIGVRDKITQSELKKLLPGKEIYLCCDPTFVYDFKIDSERERNLIKQQKGFENNKPTVVVMSDNIKINKYIYKRMHKKFNLISVASYNSKYINMPNVTPSQWIGIINCADLLFTTYFHGTCFGIITNTPFLSFGSKEKSSKVGSLLTDSAFEENYVDKIDEFIEEDMLPKVVDNFMNELYIRKFSKNCEEYKRRERNKFDNVFLNALKS